MRGRETRRLLAARPREAGRERSRTSATISMPHLPSAASYPRLPPPHHLVEGDAKCPDVHSKVDRVFLLLEHLRGKIPDRSRSRLIARHLFSPCPSFPSSPNLVLPARERSQCPPGLTCPPLSR
eukprot:609822-Hanusia_phi.AAC.1